MIRANTLFTHMSMCILAVGLFSTAYAEHKDFKDREITRFIEARLLRDEAVEAHLIDVQTNDGVVTLSGSVDNLLSQDQALRIAESIKGVKGVIDTLKVRPETRSDEQIVRDVQKTLSADPATKIHDIDVKVNEGIVTLSGKVKFWNDKQLIAQTVKGVKGIQGINNRITYNTVTVDRSDKEIKAAIERRLSLDPYVCEGMITVVVEDGTVILSGAVGSVAEKTRACNDAWVTGVVSVTGKDLDVNWWACNKLRQERNPAITSDEEIAEALKDMFLYDPRVILFNPTIEVNEGMVTLSGIVDNLKARRAAEQDALNTVGVAGVHNYLKVRPGKERNDDAIAAGVCDALKRDPVVGQSEIDVTVRNNKVYLNGTVDTLYAREHAEDAASRVCGVVDVRNNLNVEYTVTPKSDWRIKKDIDDELFWSYFVDSDDISVSVEKGVATLEGRVDSWQELNAAINNAFEGGAERVLCRLSVTGDTRDASGYYPMPFKYFRYPGYFVPVPQPPLGF